VIRLVLLEMTAGSAPPGRTLRWRQTWRKRVGVEPTILAAKDRINGFEGHEDHRTPGASVIGL
jgi:hypothetical protein